MGSLQGQLLIASPQLEDPNFKKTVVLLVQHDENGALGLILNRPMDVTINDAWEQAEDAPCSADGPLFQGGPCDGPLMAVHGDQSLSEIAVLPGVHFSTGKEALEQLVSQEQEYLKFFVGYAGWRRGQLEAEIEEGGWLLLPASRDEVFELGENLWRQLVRRAGRATSLAWIDPKLIPDDPSVN